MAREIKIKEATEKDKKEALKIAKTLPEWFNKNAIKNMPIDFNVNHVVIANDNTKIIGFLCYHSENAEIVISWMGIKKEYQRKGVGSKLIAYLERIAKKTGSRILKVETLSEKENYKPYNMTRDFYKKQGFKKIHTKQPIKEGWDIMDVLEKKIK